MSKIEDQTIEQLYDQIDDIIAYGIQCHGMAYIGTTHYNTLIKQKTDIEATRINIKFHMSAIEDQKLAIKNK